MKFDKKFWIAFVVIFIVTSALGFVVHGIWLAPDYEQLVGIMRSNEDQESLIHFMILAHLFYAFGLCWVYRMGHDGSKAWLGQGVRFGIAIAVLIWIPVYLIYHTVAMFPMAVVIKQIIGEVVSSLIVGVTLAFMHK